jgi:hypothetical protein
VLSFVIWIFLFYSFFVVENYNFFEVASTVKVAFLFDLETGLLSKASILHLFFSVGATLAIAKANKKIKYFIFSTLIEIDEEGSDAYEGKLAEVVSKVDDLSQNQKRKIETNLTEGRKAFQRLQGGSEALVSLGFGAAVGYPCFALGDFVLFLVMTGSVIYIQWQAYKKYISDIYPYLVAREKGGFALQPNLIDGISET